jgi:phospholipase C
MPIDHIVVLMLENRSFDHMLGYLTYKRDRHDIDGLPEEFAFNNRWDGRDYSSYGIAADEVRTYPDPCHTWDAIAIQLANGNQGFVESYARTSFAEGHEPSHDQLWQVMGHYDDTIVYAFDYLAKNFLVCDRWFSSLPSETQVNRMYALAGTSGGLKSDQFPPRLYDLRTVFEELGQHDVSWKAYSHDISSLRFLKQFAASHSAIDRMDKFYAAAQTGTLPAVSWIDPDFSAFGGAGDSSDDHAPADIRAGQELVARIYNALLQSPAWARTLFVVTYDEHGGFYDHVPPSSVPPPQDDHIPQYGVRVPALIVSPLVEAGVSHTVYDHTSIIRTILKRFCADGTGAVPAMTKRVSHAADLLPLVTRAAPRGGLYGIPIHPRPSVNTDLDYKEEASQHNLRALAAVAVSHGVPEEEL